MFTFHRFAAAGRCSSLAMVAVALLAMIANAASAQPRVVVPDHDPAPADVVRLMESLHGVHPRVLFTAEDLPELRRRYQEDAVARQKLDTYAHAAQPFKQPKFLKDATDGQRQGLWMMPTLALHYLVSGDTTSRDRAITFLQRLVELEHWETGKELDSGMSAANIMIGAAMVYDMLYDELPDDLRRRAAEKLLRHARAMIHGGHLNKNNATAYWQSDPANNHRWHRDAGLALCLLAVYEEQPDAQWAAAFLRDELAYVHRWLPTDGTNHEGPGYLIFGLPHLVLAMQASDRVLGTDYLGHPYFARAPWFELHAMRPGLEAFMPFGDTGEGVGFYCNALYAGASRHRDASAVAMLDRLREINPKAFAYGWMDLLWRDGSLVEHAESADPPTVGRYPDLGITFVRDSWQDDAVAAMFKAGPLGGYQLNAFREDVSPFRYINVAHCDPDANSFTIAVGPDLVAETSRYSGAKRSSSHNTILVNHTGQFAPGRKEGQTWSQPATGNRSMIDAARVLAWDRHDDGTLVIEAEAAGSYPAQPGVRPAIDRFRRTFVWRPGRYILVLDDIQSPQPADITWLTQGPTLTPIDEAAGRYRLASDTAACDFQLVSDQPFAGGIADSTADQKNKPLGWRQLQATAQQVQRVRFAAVFTPWGGDASVKLDTSEAGAAVTVSLSGGDEVWRWRFADGPAAPSSLQLQR